MIMKKILCAIMLCCMLGITACGTMKTQEAEVIVTQVTSEPGSITFTLTEDWTVQRSEELKETMNPKEGQVYDLFARNNETGTNINILYEDLTQTEGGTLVRMNDYITALKESLESSKDYSYSCTEAVAEELSGEEYQVFSTKVPELEGTQYFYIRRIDDTMMIMIISVFGEDTLESVKGSIS